MTIAQSNSAFGEKTLFFGSPLRLVFLFFGLPLFIPQSFYCIHCYAYETCSVYYELLICLLSSSGEGKLVRWPSNLRHAAPSLLSFPSFL